MKVLLLLALSLCANAAQTILLSGNVGSITWPNNTGLDNLNAFRTEVRIVNLGPCTVQTSIIRLEMNSQYWGSVTCHTVGQKSLGFYDGSFQSVATQAQLGTNTDVLVRMQKVPGTGMIMEVWASDGGALLASRTVATAYNNTTGSLKSQTTPTLRPEAGSGGEIAWLRFYNTNVPTGAGASPPSDNNSVCDTAVDCLGKWGFEGNPDGNVIGGAVLSVSKTAAAYGTSPIYTPVLFSSTTGALVAGQTAPILIDASKSFSYDGLPLSSFTWRYLSGPQQPSMSSLRGTSLSITNAVEGDHVFRLTVADSTGIFKSQDFTIPIRAQNSFGNLVYPRQSNLGTMTLRGAASIPGAVDVVVTVKKPDGRTLAPVVCSTTLACTLSVDNRQANHLYQRAYRNAGGTVIARSDWAPVITDQVEEPYLGTNPNSFNRFAVYNSHHAPWDAPLFGTAQSNATSYLWSRVMEAVLGGFSILNYNPALPVMVPYIDAIGKYPTEVHDVRAVTDAHPTWWEEDAWLHWKVNHSYIYSPTNGTSSIGWFQMDKFDPFEPTNGVYVANGSTLGANKSIAAYDTTVGDVAMSSSDNTLVIGHSQPFDQVNFVTSTAGVGCTTQWQYWNGTGWTSYTPASNTTGNFVATGNSTVMLTPPAAWRQALLNPTGFPNSHTKWQVRMLATCSGTYPVFSRIYGDDLTLGSTNTSGQQRYRGWCAAGVSSSRINTGLTGAQQSLEYDPTPPTSCQARFKWHSRSLALWGANLMMGYVGRVLDGQYVFSRILVQREIANMIAGTINGLFMDDSYPPNTKAFVEPAINPALDAATRFGLWAPNIHELSPTMTLSEYVDMMGGHVGAVRSYLRELNPNAEVHPNTDNAVIASSGDGFIAETFAKAAGDFIKPDGGFGVSPDVWKIGGTYNPTACDTKIVYAVQDEFSELSSSFGVNGNHPVYGVNWIAWDRGQRGPMNAWAAYLINANECTRFFYTTWDENFYWGPDDYEFWEETPTASLQVAVPQQINSNVKYIYADWGNFGPANDEEVRIGNTGEYIPVKTVRYIYGMSDALSQQPPGTSPIVHLVSLVDSGNVTTATFDADHGRIVGDVVWLSGVAGEPNYLGFQGTARAYTVVSVPTSTTLTFATASVVDGTYNSGSSPAQTTMALTHYPDSPPYTRLQTTSGIVAGTYDIGTPLWELKHPRDNYSPTQSFVSTRRPDINRVRRWGYWFPAMGVDVGKPDTVNGHIGDDGTKGSRDFFWINAATSGTKNGIARRDLDKAIIIWGDQNADRTGIALANPTVSQMLTYSNSFQITQNGGPVLTLFPLRVDGVTDNSVCNYGPGEDYRTANGGCDRFKVRTAEGLILMKSPVY